MIDFVIPHMGRTELLCATIQSILNQTRKEWIGKIIIVTKNKSKPDLPVSEKVNVILAPESTNISQQRNIGANLCHANMLAFLDADIELAPEWLATCVPLLESTSKRAVVSAMQQCKRPDNRIEQIRTVLSNTSLNTDVSFLPGRNLLLQRADHEQVGGFPEHLETCEDYFYTDKLNELGALYYTSDTYYFHLGEDLTLKQTFSKEIWRSEYNLYSIKGRDIPLREWPSILLPFWILAWLIIAIALASAPMISLLALCFTILPALLYSIRLALKPDLSVNFIYILVFYSTYFCARTIGTMIGLKHLWLRKNHHEA